MQRSGGTQRHPPSPLDCHRQSRTTTGDQELPRARSACYRNQLLRRGNRYLPYANPSSSSQVSGDSRPRAGACSCATAHCRSLAKQEDCIWGRPSFSASPTLPPRPPGVGACLPFSKWWVPRSDGTPPPRGCGVGQEWAGGFEGKGYIPCIFSCVGQSVSGWVPLELPPPPPGGGRSSAVGACQKWVPAKSGCLPKVGACQKWVPTLILPPSPPVAKKTLDLGHVLTRATSLVPRRGPALCGRHE